MSAIGPAPSAQPLPIILITACALVGCNDAADGTDEHQARAAAVEEMTRSGTDAGLALCDVDVDWENYPVAGRFQQPSRFRQSLLLDQRRAQFVVGGFYPSLNERFVLDTLIEVREPRLPRLLIVYMSPDPPSEELREAVRARRARIVHHAFSR